MDPIYGNFPDDVDNFFTSPGGQTPQPPDDFYPDFDRKFILFLK